VCRQEGTRSACESGGGFNLVGVMELAMGRKTGKGSRSCMRGVGRGIGV
jgi:hypothetical protein